MISQSTSKNARVTMGGVYHLPRAVYSKDTQDLVKVMMEECKLSMLKRRELQKIVENGESLPLLKSHQRPGRLMTQQQQQQLGDERVLAPCKKRSRETMVEMGVYQPEKFKPSHIVNKEEEKRRLQSIMAYGTVAPQNTDRAGRNRVQQRSSPGPLLERDRFEELVEEVRDRCQFLQDVSELGQADRYQALMETEIAAKLQAMRALDPRRCEDAQKHLRLPSAKPRNSALNGTELRLALR